MPSREVAPRPIRDIATDAIASIQESLGILSAWGAKIPAGSRLHQAVEVLKEVQGSGALSAPARKDELGLRALELATDYADIAKTLPSERVADVRRELEISLTGPLHPPVGALGPLQLQSQFILRAALVVAGLNPDHPRKAGIKSPDLLVDNGLSSYALENKRPEHEKNIISRFEDGRAQLDTYGLPGGVLVDATDCFRGHTLKQLMVDLERLARSIHQIVFEDHVGHKPGYKNIMVSGVYARLAWNVDAEARLCVDLGSVFSIYAHSRNTLLGHRARWLRDSLEEGFKLLGATVGETDVA